MKKLLISAGMATALGAIALAVQPTFADTGNNTRTENGVFQEAHYQGGGPGMGMGYGMMGGGRFGGTVPNMMGQGHGPATMMGTGMMGASFNHDAMMRTGTGSDAAGLTTAPFISEKDLSAGDVKKFLEGRLAWTGNSRLKVGDVTKKDDDTYVATIVTVDDSLVQKLEVDRKTGHMRRID